MARSGKDRYHRRSAGHRLVRPAILIVCEGESEDIYLRELKQRLRLSIDILPTRGQSAPRSVLDAALDKMRRDGPYEQVFCVFDHDAHDSYEDTLARIEKLANRPKAPIQIRAITSIPCFEVWVLLHFERTTAPFIDAHALQDRIKRNLPDYEKASVKITRNLLDKLQQALENARWLAEQTAHNGPNPSTNFHLLVQSLDSLAEK